MDKVKTGTLIKEARIRMGYTQADLGDILGVSNKAVSRWENGDSFPDVGILENIASCLNISIEELVSGEKTGDNEKTLAELTHLVRLQAKEAIRRNLGIIANSIMLLIIICRFYFAFISGKGYSWDFKYDLILLLICYLIMIFSRGKRNASLHESAVNLRFILLLTILSAIGSVLFMLCGVIFLQEVLLSFIDAAQLGPLLASIIGCITCLNICLLEYGIYKSNIKSNLTPFINITTIFLCISYREWMGSLLPIEEALNSLWIITITYVAIAISATLIGLKK